MWFRYWLYGHPFHLKGFKVFWCFLCCGWGADPDGGECSLCYGKGFK